MVSLKWDKNGATTILENTCNEKEVTLILPENMRFAHNNTSKMVVKPNEKQLKYSIIVS